MNNFKITVIGNSVALRTRPPKLYPNNKNYSQILQDKLSDLHPDYNITIENKAIGAYTSFNALRDIGYYINTFPNIFIINLGVVDSSTREMPIWFSRIANSTSNNFFHLFVKVLYQKFIKKIRPFLVILRGKKSWISKKKFKSYYFQLISTLLKETNAKIIALPINVGSNRIEKALPGSVKNHREYNTIIKKIIENLSQEYVDLKDINSDKHYPDGVHYSLEGHYIIASKLTDIIENIIR